MAGNELFEDNYIFYGGINQEELEIPVKPNDSHEFREGIFDPDSHKNLEISLKDLTRIDEHPIPGIHYLGNQLHFSTIQSMHRSENRDQEDSPNPSLQYEHQQAYDRKELRIHEIQPQEEISESLSQSIYPQDNDTVVNPQVNSLRIQNLGNDEESIEPRTTKFKVTTVKKKKLPNPLLVMFKTSPRISANQNKCPRVIHYKIFVLRLFTKCITGHFPGVFNFPEETLKRLYQANNEGGVITLFFDYVNSFSDRRVIFDRHYVEEIFSNLIFYEAYFHFVSTLFTGKSCDQLCSFFNFSCCQTGVHTRICNNKWKKVELFTAYDLIFSRVR